MTVPISIIAILLGIVEGLTEFLPVSSTGHLIVADHLLKFKEMLGNADKAELFEVVIQLGAILAIGAIYRKRLMGSIEGLLGRVSWLWRRLFRRERSDPNPSGRLGVNIVIAFLPAGVLGYAFHHIISTYLFSPLTVGITLVIGGMAIIVIEKQTRDEQRRITLETMTMWDALIVGFAQALSMIPGTSRSAATIMGGMLRGIKRASATEFSFLLAFPTMLAASGFELFKYRHLLTSDIIGMIAVGFITSFVVALAVVAWFIRYVQRHEFTGFGIYRIVFGCLVLVLWGAGYLG